MLSCLSRRPCHGGLLGIGGGRPRCISGGVPKDGCGEEPSHCYPHRQPWARRCGPPTTPTAGVFASKIVSTLGTGAVTALSGGVLTVPGAIGAAVVGVAAGVAVSSLVDNGLATVEKWIFSSQE